MVTVSEPGGMIFKIKRFSVHDGPGIRISVFLKGCSLNCVWCHSPEGIDPTVSIWHNSSVCIGCAKCVSVCPPEALRLVTGDNNNIIIDRKLCHLSGECVKNCPSGAISFTGSRISVSDVVNEIEKDILFYKVSGGGVTLTGGEPLYQHDFAFNILAACQIRDINTAIETSLFCELETILRMLQVVDLFIVDLKIFDPDMHRKYTGKSNEIIKSNFQVIAKSGKQVIVRIPMIKGITDTPENLYSIRKFVNATDNSISIEYINYNSLAENNYKRLGIPFLLGK